MKNSLKISANTNDLKDHIDVLYCFLYSANTLYGATVDGIANNRKGSIGFPTNDFWNSHFITLIFLLRHTLELAIKALIKEIKGSDIRGHNIKKLWENNIPNYQNVLPQQMDKTFNVLNRYHVLEDAQLFRYHVDNKGVQLQMMPSIENEDIEVLLGTAWEIRLLILECIHQKKELPSR